MSNSVVDFIRQQNPNETRSDAELTLLIGDSLPGQYDGYEDFKTEYDSIKKTRADFFAPSGSDYIQQAAGEAGRSFFGGLADIPESIAIGARALNQKFPLSKDVPLAEMPTYRAGQAVRAFGEAVTPAPVPGLEDSLWASKVPQGFGSAGAFLAGGAATKALKVPGLVGVAGLGAMSSAVGGYKDAIAKGASEEDAFYSYYLNGAVGTSEALPLARILKRMDGWSGGTLKKAIITAGKETFEESLQEALQGYAGNKIANSILGYDKTREDFKDVLQNAEVGGVVGATVSLLASLVGAKLRKPPASSSTPPPEELASAPILNGDLTGTDKTTRAEVLIPNKDVIENYTGALTPERQELLTGIAEQKIATGVDLSAGLAAQDRAAVSVIEDLLRKGAPTEQEVVPPVAPAAPISEPVVEAQTQAPVPEDVVAQVAPVAQPVPVEPVVAPAQPAAGAAARVSAVEGLSELDAEIMAALEEPATPIAPPTYRVSVQAPALMPNGQTMPGYVQFDEFQNGRNTRSTSAEQLRSEGLDIPDFTGLPQGQYTLEAARQLLATPAVSEKPQIVSPESPFVPEQPVVVPVEEPIDWAKNMAGAKVGSVNNLPFVLVSTEIFIKKDGEWYSKTVTPRNEDGSPRTVEDNVLRGAANELSEAQQSKAFGLVDYLDKLTENFQKLQTKQLEASLVDQIGFDNSVFKARAEEKTAIGKKGGEAVVIQPAYHERMQSEGYTPALAAQLVQNASPEGGLAKQNTHRLTVFESSEPGQEEVVVLGTFQLAGKDVSVVNPDDKRGYAMPLEKFLAQKNSEGDQLWTPIASLWVKETKNGFSERFADAKAFEGQVGKPAKEALAANARSVVAMEGAMQAQGITAEGEIIEKATEASYTPKDMADEFRDVIVEWLPRDKTGKIASNLALNDIQEVLLSAFEQEGNADVQQYALLEAISDLKDNPQFLKLGQVEQQRFILSQIAQQVYAKYKEGGFAGPDLQQGRIGESNQGGIGRSDALRQVGSKELQALAEDSAPGDGGSGSDTAEDQSVRYSAVADSAQGGRPLTARQVDDFHHILNGLALQGVNVRVVQSLVGQLGNQLHGLYSNSRKLVVLAVNDVQNPTRENLLAALEETFHAVFASESESTKRRMEAAVAGLKQGFLTAPGVNVAQVQAEESLAKLVADQLAAQGIEQPATWAQRIIALLKELYLRVALIIQQGLFGPAHTRQELATAYMQSRVTRFLAVRNTHPAFLEFIGGGKPSPATQAGFYSPAHGGGWVTEFWNPNTEEIERPVALEDSLAAVDYNHIPGLRYKAVENLTDEITSSLEPEEAAVKVATQNAVEDLYRKMFTEWTRLGHNRANLTFDDWMEANLRVKPQEVIDKQNGILQANNRPIVPRGTTISQLPAESSRRRATNNARMIVDKQRTAWSKERSEAEVLVPKNQALLTRNVTELLDLLSRWSNASALAKQTATATAEMVKEFKSDIRNIAKLAGKSGLLKQVIEGIDQKLDEPLARQYEAAIERMFKRFVTDTKGEKLVEILEAASKLNIDWRNATAKEIRAVMDLSAVANPKLALLLGKDFDSRALFAITVAFAKSNESVIEFLEMKSATVAAERDVINAALKLAIADTADSIDKARAAIVSKIPRLAVAADRLLTRLKEAKKENRRLLDETQRAGNFIDFHQDTMPVMASEIAKLETVIGAMNESWEPNDGAQFPVAPQANSTWDDVWKNQKTLGLTAKGTTSAQTRTWVEANNAWLAAQPLDERGANWASLERVTRKIELIDAKLVHELAIQGSLFNRLLGAIQDRLDYIGLPAARIAANRLRRKIALKSAHTMPAHQKGVDVDAAKARAIAATGWKGTADDFKRRFYDSIKGYFEKRKDIRARIPGLEMAVDHTWTAAWLYLEGDPQMAAMLSRPGAREAVRKYVDLASRNNSYIDKLKFSQEFGGKVEDKEAGIFRESIGDPDFDTPRRVGKWMGALVHGMREAWGGTATAKLNKEEIAAAYQQDPAALRAALAPRFTPDVWQMFVKAIAYRPGRSLFYAPEAGGVNPMARFTKDAFDAAATGDAVGFAEALYQLEGGTTDLATFIGETLSTLQAQYSALAAVFNEENAPTKGGPPVPAKVIGDARKSEDFPSEWMDYQEFGSQEMRHMIELLSFEAAYGHNMHGLERDLDTAENQLELQVSALTKLESEVSARTLQIGKSQRVYRKELAEAAERTGAGNWIRLSNAQRNLATLRDQREQIHRLIEMQSGVPPELRSWFEMVSLLARTVVQRVGTALIDLVTPIEGPFRLMGISTPAFKHIFTSGKFAVSEAAASLFQAFGVELHMQAEKAKRLTELGMGDTDASMWLKDRMLSALTTPTSTTFQQPQLRAIEAGLQRFARAGGAVLSTGIGRAKPGSLLQTTTFQPWAAFTMENKIVHAAEAVGTWRLFEDLVQAGRDFYARNPAALADVANHRFTPQELGYKKHLLGLVNNERAFAYLNKKLGDFGMNLESLARNALANPNAPVFSHEQLKLLAALVRQEITLESDESNLSASFFTNPVLFMAKPLIGWGIGKTGAFFKGFREPNGVRSHASVRAGLLALLGAAIPIGLAFAMIRDWWDEEVVGKKANVAQFGQGNDFNALIDKLARVGTFGEIASPVNAYFNQDIHRPFSVDSRVFFLSSIFNTVQALGTWGRQGTATYASVYRPLASSLGGGGFLETIDVINNLTGADNAESRVVARINVNNYLRAVGRELGLDVLRSSGGPTLSNSIKPHVSNMLLASYANDYTAFKDAYDKAIEAAREEGKPDPEDHVKRSFASYHPLRTVFRTPPSEAEYRGILSALNPRGQADVAQAVDLYNRYAEVLGIKEFEGKKVKPKTGPTQSREARMRAALGLREEGIFAR